MEPATPKQIAFLEFMGVRNARDLTRDEASSRIEHWDDNLAGEELEAATAKKIEWSRAKFVRHPDLYTYELKNFLIHELPDELHQFVRSRVVGASGRLTKKTIRQVINTLGRAEPDWWQKDDYRDVFFAKLQQVHPECCDGRIPTQKRAPLAGRQHVASGSTSTPKKSSCLGTTIVLLFFIGVLVFLWFQMTS
jgi:hypothetical protein